MVRRYLAKKLTPLLCSNSGLNTLVHHILCLQGEVNFVVESSILLFMNHGCNGTYNFGDDVNSFTEMNFESSYTKDSIIANALISKTPPFSPVLERHLGLQTMYGDLTLRDINEGEEILTDYLHFGGDQDGIMEDALG
jgi:hypothetical protein